MSRAELLYGLAAAGANVLGALAVISHAKWTLRALDAMLSLAAGFLISVSLVDLFPQAVIAAGATAPVVVLLAYLLVHLTQHLVKGTASAADHPVALDLALDKVERQMRRLH